MSKVLHMIDFDLLITYRHQEFLIEKNMENESATDEDKFESYVNPDGEDEPSSVDYSYDDIPF